MIMSNNQKDIVLKHFYGSSITSRSAIRSLFLTIQDKNDLTIDFQGIEFISRSSLHQLIFEESRLNNLKLKNLDSNILKMYNVVKKSYNGAIATNFVYN